MVGEEGCKTKFCSSPEHSFIAFCWRPQIFPSWKLSGRKIAKTEVEDENLDCVPTWIWKRKCSLRLSFKCWPICCLPSLRLEYLLYCVGIKCVPVSSDGPTRSQQPVRTLLCEETRWPSLTFLFLPGSLILLLLRTLAEAPAHSSIFILLMSLLGCPQKMESWLISSLSNDRIHHFPPRRFLGAFKEIVIG